MTFHNIIPFPVPLPAPTVSGPLRRPVLLIRAARLGQPGWRRGRDLPKLLKCETVPLPGDALPQLREMEQALNDSRQVGAAEYDIRQHVTLMIAILAEIRAVTAERAATPQPSALG